MIDRTITLLKFRNVLKSINLTKKIFIELDEHGLLKTLALNPNVKSSDLILLEDFWSVNNSRNNYISSDKIEDHKLKEYNNNILALNPNVKSSDLILLEDFWSVNNSRNNYISSDKIEDHKLKEYNNNILALIEQQLREMDWINIANSELKKVL